MNTDVFDFDFEFLHAFLRYADNIECASFSIEPQLSVDGGMSYVVGLLLSIWAFAMCL